MAPQYGPVIETIYDFAVLELVHNYYLRNCNSNQTDFLRFHSSPQGLEEILKDQLEARMKPLVCLIKAKEAFWEAKLGVDKFQIVGDLHGPITKIKIGDYIYHENFLHVESFLQNLLQEQNSIFGIFIPRFEVNGEYVKRKFIEFNDMDFSPRDYYYNFGVLLASALYLRMADLHMENVVFNDNAAKVIDFEFMFAPDYDHLKYGMRPTHLVDHIGVDNTSALYGGYRTIYSYTKPVLFLKDRFSPEIVWKVPSKRKIFNIPSLDKFGHDLPHKYIRELASGFDFATEELIKNKSKIIDHAKSASFSVRQLVRPTVQYRYLIVGYGYPQINRGSSLADYYEVVFRKNPWKDFFTPKPKILKKLEIEDCGSYLIPYFYSDIKGKEIFHSSGVVIGHLKESPLDTFLKFIKDDEFYRAFAKKQLALTKRYITLNSQCGIV